MERWVEYDGKFFNMMHVTHFKVQFGWLRAYLTVGVQNEDETPTGRVREVGEQLFIALKRDLTDDEAKELIRAIIRGEYDVLTGTRIRSKPADAQASASVEDVQKAIDDDNLPF